MTFYQPSENGSSGVVALEPSAAPFSFDNIVGSSPAIVRTVAKAEALVGRTDTHVVITGDPGSGRRLLARALHYSGPRGLEPLLSVDCRETPEHVLEAELFGKDAGIVPGASAKRGLLELVGRGTILIDDVDHLPQRLQPLLLRALEDGAAFRVGSEEPFGIDCRVVCLTKTDLGERVAVDGFHPELYARLAGATLDVPPLREREGDPARLARHFVDAFAEEGGLGRIRLSYEAERALNEHLWPGNVRELRFVIQGAIAECSEGEVRPENLKIGHRQTLPADQAPPSGFDQILIPHAGKKMSQIECEAIRITLDLTDGNQSAAARLLGISRPTIIRKINRYGLRKPR